MKRDIAALADREFDLVVVGAGVYGAATAWDASLRGLSVALIDKGDFGSGTSFNNLKTIHGGLRYLQHADFTRMRECASRRTSCIHCRFLSRLIEGACSRAGQRCGRLYS